MRKRKKKWRQTLAMTGSCCLLASVTLGPLVLQRAGFRKLLKFSRVKLAAISTSTPTLNEWVESKKGEPLFGNWLEKSSKELALNPHVREARVARTSTGAAVVKVEERSPVAWLLKDRLYNVDARGEMIDPVSKDQLSRLSLVIFSGTLVGAEQVRDGLGILESLKSAGFQETEISELRWEGERGWTLFGTGLRVPIRLGSDEIEAKGRRLLRVLEDFRGKESTLKELDADFQDRVVVKLLDRKEGRSGNGKAG